MSSKLRAIISTTLTLLACIAIMAIIVSAFMLATSLALFALLKLLLMFFTVA